jgi:1,4-alpha-glucan branching enzyme
MITRRKTRDTETVSITFSANQTDPSTGAVSVVGDFNGWDPAANPLLSRAGGPPKATVRLRAGQVYRFRYVTDGGHWFDDERAHGYEPNGFGGNNCLLDLAEATR